MPTARGGAVARVDGGGGGGWGSDGLAVLGVVAERSRALARVGRGGGGGGDGPPSLSSVGRGIRAPGRRWYESGVPLVAQLGSSLCGRPVSLRARQQSLLVLSPTCARLSPLSPREARIGKPRRRPRFRGRRGHLRVELAEVRPRRDPWHAASFGFSKALESDREDGEHGNDALSWAGVVVEDSKPGEGPCEDSELGVDECCWLVSRGSVVCVGAGGMTRAGGAGMGRLVRGCSGDHDRVGIGKRPG